MKLLHYLNFALKNSLIVLLTSALLACGGGDGNIETPSDTELNPISCNAEQALIEGKCVDKPVIPTESITPKNPAAKIKQINTNYKFGNVIGRNLKFTLTHISSNFDNAQTTVKWTFKELHKTITTKVHEQAVVVPDIIGNLTVQAEFIQNGKTMGTARNTFAVVAMQLTNNGIQKTYLDQQVTVNGVFPMQATARMDDGSACNTRAGSWIYYDKNDKSSYTATKLYINCNAKSMGLRTISIYPSKDINQHAVSFNVEMQNYSFAKYYDVLPDIANCQAGTLNQQTRDRALKAVNDIRALHGLRAVTYDVANEHKPMQAALVNIANNIFTHHPPQTSKCYSTDGDAGAASSNLSKSNNWIMAHNADKFAALEEDQIGYLTDVHNVTANNVGHRRWLLDPFTEQISYGLVIDNKGLGIGATWNKRTPTKAAVAAQDYVAYPMGNYPAKYFDKRALLSFAALSNKQQKWQNTADYSNTTLNVTRADNALVTIKKQSFDNVGYGLRNNYQFWIENIEYGVEYTVNLRNVLIDNTARDYSYKFKIIP